MRLFPTVTIAALAFGGVACTPLEDGGEAGPDSGEPPATTCGAETMQGLVGQSFTVIDPAALPPTARVNFPGAAVNGDVSPTRLNFDIGTNDRIKRVYCG